MEEFNGIEVIPFKDVSEWETWLTDHYELQIGVWIKTAKKSAGKPTIMHLEALDVALCYGWIDGQRRSYKDPFYLQKFTPRRPRSLWSKINIGKVETLIAVGKMQAPGQAEIDKAKADGRWDAAYESQKNATVPADLEAALQKSPKAKRFFESLDKANRYSVLWRLMTAKTPEMRTARLEKMLAMLEAGEKHHVDEAKQ